MATQFFSLKALNGDQQLVIDGEMMAGRDATCAIVLSVGQASRQHARLSPADQGVLVEDLNSTNGTFVNDKKITAPTLITPGDELRIGKIKFIIEPLAEQDTTIDSESDADADADATRLFVPGSETAEPANQPAPPAKSGTEKAKKRAVAEPEKFSDSKAPPSWVLNNQQSVDGTKFLSKNVMIDVLKNSSGGIKEKVDAPTLIGSSDPIAGMRFQLLKKNPGQWEIGRATSSDVMINHDSVSSNHAQIINEGTRWKITDLMSANGTYVNAKKGLSSYLSSGDVLRFGHVECTFVLPEPEAAFDKSATDPSIEIVVEKTDKSRIKMAALAFVVTGLLVVAVILGFSLWL